jgi:NAD-dependent dihydropyrimidine dehydrogenase PreA subunit
MRKKPLIVFCNCGHTTLVPEAKKRRILRAIASCEADFEAVQDLCGLAARKDRVLSSWARRDDLTIVACFPRAVKWLFLSAGAELPETARLVNARTGGAGEISASIAGKGRRRKIDLPQKGSWVPWFPVIDYDRCKSCRQCLQFCLFGVYALSGEERIEVRQPANCKTNCPACARICPNTAIMFPKYGDGPIAGDAGSGRKDGEPLRVDLSAVSREQVLELIKRRGAGVAGPGDVPAR